MSFQVLLLLQLTILSIYGFSCQIDQDCPSYMGCDNDQCKLCGKLGTTCQYWPCCSGKTCQKTVTNSSVCFPESCVLNFDCGGGYGCKDGKCDLCYKDNDFCLGKLLECCSGTCDPVTATCQPPNNVCKVMDDCSQGLGCLFRTGKCGLCSPIGETCTLPVSSLECCSSYCKIGIDGNGVCTDPRIPPRRRFFASGPV